MNCSQGSKQKHHQSQQHRSVLDFDTVDELTIALQSVRITNNNVPFDQAKQTVETDWVLPNSSRPNPSVTQELERLQCLRSFNVLSSDGDDISFKQLVQRVRLLCHVPCAFISLVDLGRQWFKAMDCADDFLPPGCPQLQETARRDALCAHTILEDGDDPFLQVTDTMQDDRFRENPYVKGESVANGLTIRFYAGAALVAPSGHKLGALCVVDTQPRSGGLTKQQKSALQAHAAVVVQLLVERKERMEQKQQQQGGLQDSKLSAPIVMSVVEVKPSGVCGSKRRASEADMRASRSDMTADVDITGIKPVSDADCSVSSASDSSLSMDTGSPNAVNTVIPKPIVIKPDVVLPDPKASTLDPDHYLAQLTEALWGVSVMVKPALELEDFFPMTTDEQVAAYSVEVVTITRQNQVDKLRDYFQNHGRSSLNCFNRFGEGLLNMACRRGFKDIVQFLLSDAVDLAVRVRDDYGRTPLHDACWHPEPQLQICEWILAKDPSLFLISDKRGYTPFQYARKSDWPVWRQFLYNHVQQLERLVNDPDLLTRFSTAKL